MKILIAEDDSASLKILRLTLQGFGHEVIEAEDGDKAWERLLREPVRLIVSDWMMPGLDGLELCRKIRARRKKDYVYFILLTAVTGREGYLKAMDAGVDDFLNKPLRQEELLTRLRVAERILNYINEVRELRRILPICSFCKKVRDDKDYWHQIENYIREHTSTDFSHSICPKCYEEHIKPQLEALQAQTGAES
jgi:DNA-binding response OmpR family regulator